MASTVCTSLILVLCVSTLGARIDQASLEPKKFQKGERCNCGIHPHAVGDYYKYISKNTCCEDGLVCSGKLKHILVIGQDAYKNHRCKPDLGPKGSPCTKKSECPSSGPYSYGHWVSCQVLAGEADQHPHCCIQSYNNSWGSEGWKNFWFTSLNYGAASDGKRGKVTHNTSCCSGKSATLEGSIGPVCID